LLFLEVPVCLLSFVTKAEIGHYYFYVALYYKKHNSNEYYKQFLDASKQSFQANGTIKDFYSLKKDFDKKIFPDRALELNEDKYI
jgi:hypothetical protein